MRISGDILKKLAAIKSGQSKASKHEKLLGAWKPGTNRITSEFRRFGVEWRKSDDPGPPKNVVLIIDWWVAKLYYFGEFWEDLRVYLYLAYIIYTS